MIKWFCFLSNSLLWSLRKYINLLFLFFISTFTLHDFKYQTNDLITSSNYPVQCFKLFFTSISFEVTILSLLMSQIFIGFLAPQNSSFALPDLNTIILWKNVCHYFSPFLYCYCVNVFLFWPKLFYNDKKS